MRLDPSPVDSQEIPAQTVGVLAVQASSTCPLLFDGKSHLDCELPILVSECIRRQDYSDAADSTRL